MPITLKQIFRYWYILSMMVIVVGLPFSKLLLSIGQFMMAGGWIVERFDGKRWMAAVKGMSTGRIILLAPVVAVSLFGAAIGRGFRDFSRNRAALLFASVLLLHVAGLLWTTDFNYAFKDLRTKLPLLLLPLFLSTTEAFGKKAFYAMMGLFILAVLTRSVFNTWLILTRHFVDIRDVSHNVSHITYSLLICMCLYTLVFFLFKRNLFPLWQRALILLVLGWLAGYLVLSQSFTGISVALITFFILIPVLIFKTRKLWLKISLAFGILAIATVGFFALRSIVRDYYHVNPVDYTKLEKTTSRGNPYIHNIYAARTENGYSIWIYYQEDELREAWNKRSRIPYDSLNLKSGPISFTIIRYLTSKGWKKDADAVERLTPEEVSAIEKGIANCIFLKEFGIRGRIYEFLWGYDNYIETGNPTGSTIMQRLEFWKASVGIIKEHWLWGVGTGDMNIAFRLQYEKMHTKLAPDQRWRSHNQYLSIFIGFGIFGFIWFLVSLFWPPVMLHRYGDYFFMVFLIISLMSMLTDDTIESQTGVSFFAFFYALFLFGRKENDAIIQHDIKP
ncbi:MAG: O-antigen ligase family protein [Bacteroidota bacterium]